MSAHELKRVGLKVTVPRIKIFEALAQAKPRHLSAEQVYQLLSKMGEDVGLATVYRVLTQFEQAGLVIRHHFEGGHSIFEPNDSAHHDHLICIHCQQVQEFIDPLIEKRQLEIAKLRNFKITHHSLALYGLCERCQYLELDVPRPTPQFATLNDADV